MAPDSDAGKEMALCVSAQIVWSDIFNTPFVNISRRNVAGCYQVAQPCGCEWFYLVVVRCHALASLAYSHFPQARHRSSRLRLGKPSRAKNPATINHDHSSRARCLNTLRVLTFINHFVFHGHSSLVKNVWPQLFTSHAAERGLFNQHALFSRRIPSFAPVPYGLWTGIDKAGKCSRTADKRASKIKHGVTVFIDDHRCLLSVK